MPKVERGAAGGRWRGATWKRVGRSASSRMLGRSLRRAAVSCARVGLEALGEGVRGSTVIGVPGLRVNDLRHTAASVWLGSGADSKAVQRVLRHATTFMTMDRTATWSTAIYKRLRGVLGGISGGRERITQSSQRHNCSMTWALTWSPCRNRTDDLLITRTSRA
jgi:hypothetical protein